MKIMARRRDQHCGGEINQLNYNDAETAESAENFKLNYNSNCNRF